jgi:DNA repair protein RecO (recombination protein O)
MIKTIKGVVVSETPYKESSKILNILTNEGIIGVISKGCKNIKSPLRIVSNKLTYAEYIIYYHEDSLSTLKEGSIINNLSNIKTNLTLISYLIYLTDLTKQVISEGNKEVIFEDYINTILKIEEGLNPLILTNILEVKYLDYLGAPINFNSCVKCGNDKDIVTISSIEGGYICKNCYTNEIIYDSKVIKMLKMYYLVDIKTIKELKISDSVINSINEFLTDYYDTYTGIYIKSKSFLNKQIEY